MISRKASQIAKGSKNQAPSNQISTVIPRRIRRRQGLRLRYLLMALILSLVMFACINTSKSVISPVAQSSTESTFLKIWCDKAFTVEEDEALQQLVSNWEQQSGNKIKLSFYTNDELPQTFVTG